MKISVTGSRGFIGSRLTELLTDLGHEVIEWDHHINEKRDIKEWNHEGCDAVVHLAGYANVRKSLENPEKYWHNNVELSKNLFHLALKAQKQLLGNFRIIYASSSCAKKWWLSPYGTSKKAMELIAPPRSLGMRFTTVYGPGSREDMLIGRIRDKKLKYVTDHIRDFIHVDDICNAIITNLNDTKLNGVIDVGTGTGVKINELAKTFNIDVPLQDGDQCEAKENVADTEVLLKTGWRPKYNVEEYIKEIL